MAKNIAVIYAGAKYWGGVETYLANLFGYRNKSETSLELISLGNWELNKKVGSASLFTSKNWHSLGNFNLIKKHLLSSDTRLIVSQGMVGSFYARVLSIITGIPNLIVVHSDWHSDYVGTKKVIYYISDRLLRGKTLKYIAVSKYLKSQLLKDGVPAEKIEVVYNGVPALGGTLVKNAFSQKNPLVVGSIGRLHPVKNYDSLIKAMADLKDKDIELRIIGEGPEHSNLQAIISQNNLEKNVRLLGYIKDIHRELHNFDIYIQPSLSEGFGLTVIEAMQLGIPVIVSPKGSLPELVEDEKTGIVMAGIEPRDISFAISTLTEMSELRHRVGEAGKEAALKKFGVTRWVNEIDVAFNEVAK